MRKHTEEEIEVFVKDYMWKLWKRYFPEKAKFRANAIKRLKIFMNNHPDVTLEDVREAIEYYIRVTPRKYIRYPNYFIYKHGVKNISNAISTLEEVLEELKDRNDNVKMNIE